MSLCFSLPPFRFHLSMSVHPQLAATTKAAKYYDEAADDDGGGAMKNTSVYQISLNESGCRIYTKLHANRCFCDIFLVVRGQRKAAAQPPPILPQ